MGIKTCVIVGMTVIVAGGGPAWAWWGNGHVTIAQGVLQDLGGTGDLQRFFGETNDQFTKIPYIEPASAHFIDIDWAGATSGNAGVVSYAADFANFRAGTFTFPATLAAATLATLSDKMRAAVTYDDWYRLLQTAGALAHYIQDMHQPMHLTKDFNGIPPSGLHANYEGAQFEEGSVSRYPELRASMTPVAPTYYGTTASGGFVAALFNRIPTDYDKNVAIRNANTVAQGAGVGVAYYDSLWAQTKGITKDSFQDAAAVTASALYTAYINAGSPAIPRATFYATPAKEQSTILETGPVSGFTNEATFRVRGSGTPSYGVVRFDMGTIKAQYDGRFGVGLWGIDNLAFAAEVSSLGGGSLKVFYSSDDVTNIQGGSVLRYGDGGAPLGVNIGADTPLLQYAIGAIPTYTITRFDSNTAEAFGWGALRGDILGGGVITLVVVPGTAESSALYYGGAGLSLEVTALAVGDANRDGKIDGDDYALVDRGFGRNLTGWSNGDFNGDGVINAADYLLMDRAFVFQGGALAPGFLEGREAQFGAEYVADLVGSIPEPSVLGVVAIPLVVLRRRQSGQA